ncbi:MAG TPA: gliding motility-associated ABC transporter permease subunit GldF, partial [Muricauda sp.]|nr:gliding motility-associated ABC transporter permease subunit GldF [Allomuricauda sp.]
NQIIAFLVGILVCFLIFNGFDAASSLFSNGETQQTIQSLGAKTHFDSIARGVIDTRDLVFFISLTLLFLYLTFQRLKQLPR